MRTRSTARAARADSMLTCERILDACESLFSERGYSGTSVRAIAERAGVNLAAAHYHFGSKEKLLHAVLARSAAPINAERLARLDALEAGAQPPALADLVRSFIEPVFSMRKDPVLPKLLARLFSEPRSVSVPVLERIFRSVAHRYAVALARALPALTPADVAWRLHILVGAMSHLANFGAPPDMLRVSGSAQGEVSRDGVEQLIQFAVAGCASGAGR